MTYFFKAIMKNLQDNRKKNVIGIDKSLYKQLFIYFYIIGYFDDFNN